MRLGHSALMRKALEKEQQTQNEMIQSLMPQKVAHEVMQGSYNSEDEDEANEDEGDNELRMVSFKKEKKDAKVTNLGKTNVKDVLKPVYMLSMPLRLILFLLVNCQLVCIIKPRRSIGP